MVLMAKNDNKTCSAELYVPTDFFLLRAPALPAQTFQQLSDTGAQEQVLDLDQSLSVRRTAAQQLLLAMSSDPQIEEAIAVASASLHKGLVQLRNGDASPNRTKKIFSGLQRYMIRMSTRPTPFGLFSGVALGSFGEETSIQIGVPAITHIRTRADMHWLLAVLKDLEASPAVVEQLCVYTNQMVYITGGRVYLPHVNSYGKKHYQVVSLRATSVVRAALELAQKPLPYRTLRRALLQAFPSMTIEQAESLLQQLWEHGLLLSTLHPSLTTTQPTHYLYQQLGTLQGVEEVRSVLGAVLESALVLDTAGSGSRLDPLNTLAQIQSTLGEGKKQHTLIQVDSLLSLHSSQLHSSIGDVAARAAELLLRLTPLPEGFTNLNDYRHKFLEKYGLGAEVPLLELLSPERGLGAPSSYIQSPSAYHMPPSSQHPAYEKRQRVLQTLVQDALNSHRLEVELTEAHLRQLETWKPNLEQAPRSMEIYLHVQAASRGDLDQGKFCAVVGPNPGAPGGGRSFGRFLDLLGEPGRCALQSLLAQEEAFEPETLFAELSYQPQRARSSNVAIRPGLRTYEIAIGTTPSVPHERVIALSDLVVGVHHGHFYLRSLYHQKKVIACQLHMLNIHQAPHVCRFLADISSDGLPVLSSFDWGHLSSAPFLPRLTIPHGSQAMIVLTPARWNLDASTIQLRGEGSREARWFAGLQQWRSRWRVPRYVYLTQADNRLLLDLEHPLMAAELFEELSTLKGGQQVILQELLPDFDHLWLTDTKGAGYFCEIVVPLLRRDALEQNEPMQASAPARTVHLVSHVASQQERVFYPGSTWNYVKLYCTEAQQEEIIAGPMHDLICQLREQDLIDRWFFLRYADPEPHLRLRIHTPESKQIQSALSTLLSWSHQLATQGLIQHYTFDTYEREVARYGGPMAIDILEQVFSVDSEICSRLIAAHYTHRLTLDPLAVAVYSLDRFFAAWNYDSQQLLLWLQKRTEKYAWSKEFRPRRKLYCELLAPLDEQADPELLGQRYLLHSLLAPLENKLSPLAAQVRDLARAGQLWVTEAELVASLAHMHKIRLLDLNVNKELQLYAFWRYTLESISLRHGKKSI